MVTAGERKRHDAFRVAHEREPVPDPENAGDRERNDEVRGVDEGEGDVPAVDDDRVVDVGLQPLGGRRAEEQRPVEVDHRLDVNADSERVGGAAGEVVGAQDDDDRQPVDDQLQHLARMAAE